MKKSLLVVATGIALSLSVSAIAATPSITSATQPADLQLWRLDCGTI
jgi:hypothetical protein